MIHFKSNFVCYDRNVCNTFSIARFYFKLTFYLFYSCFINSKCTACVRYQSGKSLCSFLCVVHQNYLMFFLSTLFISISLTIRNKCLLFFSTVQLAAMPALKLFNIKCANVRFVKMILFLIISCFLFHPISCV